MRKSFVTALILVFSAMGAPVCAFSNEKTEVAQALELCFKALNKKDLSGLMEFVSNEMVFWPFQDKEILGSEEYKKLHASWFSNPSAHTISYSIEQLHAENNVAFAAVQAVLSTEEMGIKRSETSRVTMGLLKSNGKWQIVHDHYSKDLQTQNKEIGNL